MLRFNCDPISTLKRSGKFINCPDRILGLVEWGRGVVKVNFEMSTGENKCFTRCNSLKFPQKVSAGRVEQIIVKGPPRAGTTWSTVGTKGQR